MGGLVGPGPFIPLILTSGLRPAQGGRHWQPRGLRPRGLARGWLQILGPPLLAPRMPYWGFLSRTKSPCLCLARRKGAAGTLTTEAGSGALLPKSRARPEGLSDPPGPSSSGAPGLHTESPAPPACSSQHGTREGRGGVSSPIPPMRNGGPQCRRPLQPQLRSCGLMARTPQPGSSWGDGFPAPANSGLGACAGAESRGVRGRAPLGHRGLRLLLPAAHAHLRLSRDEPALATEGQPWEGQATWAPAAEGLL